MGELSTKESQRDSLAAAEAARPAPARLSGMG